MEDLCIYGKNTQDQGRTTKLFLNQFYYHKNVSFDMRIPTKMFGFERSKYRLIDSPIEHFKNIRNIS